VGLFARDMVYIFFELEKKYSIQFAEMIVLDANFYTLEGLSRAIVAAKQEVSSVL
jgi:hypothetical protein